METPMFTIFTTHGSFGIHADRWGVRNKRVFFMRGTMDEPWYDVPEWDLLYVRRNR